MAIIKRLGKYLGWLLSAVAATVLIANVYTICVRLFTDDPQPDIFGWSWAVVVSGSMEPEIHTDDLVIVRDTGTYEIGEVVSFWDGNAVVTHRIIGQTSDGFITKGDANNTSDTDPCPPENIVGEVAYVIPGVGTVIGYLRSPLGILGLILCALLLFVVPHALEENKKKV